MACISNAGYVQAAKDQAEAIKNKALADTLIFTALALWQRNSSSSVASMQNEIAKRQTKLAKDIDAHARKYWPYEKAYVDDAFGLAKVKPQHDSLSSAWSAIADDTLRKGRSDWIAEMKSRCLTPSPCEVARWDRNAQKARADLISHADRQAESRAEIINDLRYARQLSALALGRGLASTVASYQDIAGTLGVNARASLTGTINSGLEALGYVLNRNRPTGWGAQTFPRIDRMPYEVQQQTAPPISKPTPAQSFPAPVDKPLEIGEDGCGPEPSYENWEAWTDWMMCMGYK